MLERERGRERKQGIPLGQYSLEKETGRERERKKESVRDIKRVGGRERERERERKRKREGERKRDVDFSIKTPLYLISNNALFLCSSFINFSF